MYLPPFGPFGDPAVLVDLAVGAERAGWDGVFRWDHVVTDAMPIVDTWTTLGRFGETTDTATRSTMLDEGLGVVRTMWSGEPLAHDGPHYRLNLAETAPEPHPIPVWIGCSTSHPNVIRRAAAADGVFPNPVDRTPTADDIARLLDAVGRPLDIAVAGNASHAWNEPVTIDLAGLGQAGMTWWMESLIHFDPLELSLEVVDAGPPPPQA